MEKKNPTNCNHCKSHNIVFNTMGRSEWWYCKDCKNEVTHVEAKTTPDPWDWKAYTQNSLYGFDGNGENDGSNYLVSLPEGQMSLEDFKKKWDMK